MFINKNDSYTYFQIILYYHCTQFAYKPKNIYKQEF